MAMELKDIIIGVIFFSMVIGASFMIFGDLGNTHGVAVDDEWNETFNKLSDAVGISNDASLSIEPSGAGEEQGKSSGDESIFDFMVSSAYTVLKQVWGGLSILKDLIYEIPLRYGVPSWVMMAIYGIIVITAAFLFISAVMRHKIG